jgi:hypothetical protein
MAQQTDPLASGMSTSEGRLTVALCLVGVALEAFSAVLAEKLDVYPNLNWLSVTALVVGAAVQLLSILGYTRNRSALKSNALAAAIAAGVPVVVTAISQAALRNLPAGVREQARAAAALPSVEAMHAAEPAAKAAAQGVATAPRNP